MDESTTVERKTVLIVDDDQSILELIQDTLADGSYTCIGVKSGQEAVDVLKKQKVDLVVADIALDPAMDGFDVCKHVKTNKETSRVPVMMLSAKGQMNDKLDAVDAGADDYMVKPFNPSELAKRVRLNLNLRF